MACTVAPDNINMGTVRPSDRSTQQAVLPIVVTCGSAYSIRTVQPSYVFTVGSASVNLQVFKDNTFAPEKLLNTDFIVGSGNATINTFVQLSGDTSGSGNWAKITGITTPTAFSFNATGYMEITY